MDIKLEAVFCEMTDEKAIKSFLADLLSPKEYESLKERWNVVQLLEEGIPYREISEKTGVSTATVTRVARCLAHPQSGYRKALEIFS